MTVGNSVGNWAESSDVRKAKQVRLVNQTKHFTLRVDNKVRLCSAISNCLLLTRYHGVGNSWAKYSLTLLSKCFVWFPNPVSNSRHRDSFLISYLIVTSYQEGVSMSWVANCLSSQSQHDPSSITLPAPLRTDTNPEGGSVLALRAEGLDFAIKWSPFRRPLHSLLHGDDQRIMER